MRYSKPLTPVKKPLHPIIGRRGIPPRYHQNSLPATQGTISGSTRHSLLVFQPCGSGATFSAKVTECARSQGAYSL